MHSLSLKNIIQIAGPLIAFILLMLPVPNGMPEAAWRVAAVAIWMALWWAFEAVPIAVTALLPIMVFPLLSIATIKSVTAPYANPIIYLFLGGFIVGKAIERCGLHRRIALSILSLCGADGRKIIAGFMLASAFLSMWISNTSTTMMLLPIGLSIIAVITSALPNLSTQQLQKFQVALLLAIAYSATLGGVATLVGTPPNAFLAAFMSENYGREIGFSQWFSLGLPVTLIMLPIVWWLLVRVLFSINFHGGTAVSESVTRLYNELGVMSVAEKRVAAVFVLMALAWIGRPLLNTLPSLQLLSDSGIALIAAGLLFVIPNGEKAKDNSLITWQVASELPWGVLILFGGGLSLASVVTSSGLAQYLGESLEHFSNYGIAALVVMAVLLVIFLTELTSNIATTATFLPVVAAVAVSSGVDPMVLAVPITLAASFAFMLPVATAPNAVVFSSGLLSIKQMVRAGVLLNIVGALLVSLISIFLVPIIF